MYPHYLHETISCVHIMTDKLLLLLASPNYQPKYPFYLHLFWVAVYMQFDTLKQSCGNISLSFRPSSSLTEQGHGTGSSQRSSSLGRTLLQTRTLCDRSQPALDVSTCVKGDKFTQKNSTFLQKFINCFFSTHY